MGTPAGLVILFGTIPITIPYTTPTLTPHATHIDTTLIPAEIPAVSPIIPSSPDYTPASPDYLPASDTEFDSSEDPSSNHIPPLPATSPFLASIDDSSDSEIPNTLPSPTHDLFTSDDSSETLSDSSSDDLSDSSSGHSSSDHSSPVLPSGTRSSHQLCSSVLSIPHSSAVTTERPPHTSSASPSRKRNRSSTICLLISSPITRALSPARADLLPPPKRIRSSDFVIDLEDCLDESFESFVPRETSLKDDIVVRGSDEPQSEHDIDPKIQVEIDECIAYVDAL
ncbi:hypothetical protein Tco_1177395 [Tanacetum coccineum]